MWTFDNVVTQFSLKNPAIWLASFRELPVDWITLYLQVVACLRLGRDLLIRT